MKQNDAAAAKRLKRQKDILKKVAVALVSILLLVVFLGTFYLRDFRFRPGGADH